MLRDAFQQSAYVDTLDVLYLPVAPRRQHVVIEHVLVVVCAAFARTRPLFKVELSNIAEGRGQPLALLIACGIGAEGGITEVFRAPACGPRLER
jgi:hypothetical protein